MKYYFLGSEPIEPKEAEQQWFIVGTAKGEKKGLFATYKDAVEYMDFMSAVQKMRQALEKICAGEVRMHGGTSYPAGRDCVEIAKTALGRNR